jgi:hypothetical protein
VAQVRHVGQIVQGDAGVRHVDRVVQGHPQVRCDRLHRYDLRSELVCQVLHA